MDTVTIVCLALMVIFGVTAAMMQSGIKAAIALGVTSIFLSILLFIMKCPIAAVFELSVCSGLITAIFISTASMTERGSKTEAEEKKTDYNKRFVALPFILIIAGVALATVVILTGFDLNVVNEVPAAEESFKEVFWNTRQADILGQIIVVLAGAFAVVALIKERNKI